ncbi:MAG TPA: VWA domain-containing protein [Thermoanaerobaculia bacterium]|nr:VWA domain-containing protein [Thermoanaerobaculia bacterium]
MDVPDLFGEVIDVRVVNLEVVVTDRSGARVRGLEPEDFELIVDGRVVPIDYFTEIFGGEALGADDRGEDGAVSRHAVVPGLAPGEPVGTNYLVYVDDNHTLKVVRDEIVRGIIDDLPRLGEHDRMAVVVQSGPRVEMLSSWSRSQRELSEALGKLLDGRLYGGSIRSSLYVARASAIAASRARGGEAVAPPGLGGAAQRVDLELAIAGVVSTLRGFAQPPGRKVMMVIAGDWPIGAFRTDDDSLDHVTELDLMAQMVETANLLGYTLYPVGSSFDHVVWRYAGMRRVARDTGGRPLFDQPAVLADAIEDTRSYYWLGFTPDFSGDDSRHEVRVRLRDPALVARSRTGYLDLSRTAELSMSTQSALLFGHETPGAPLRIELGRATRWGLRKMDVPITVYVPLDEVTFLEQGDEEIGRLEIRLAVVDSSGSQADIPIIPLVLQGEREGGEYYRYETSLHMRRRPHELVVSVHDPLGNKTLHGRAELSFRSTRD